MKIHAQDGYRGPSGVFAGVFWWCCFKPTCLAIGVEVMAGGIMLFVGPLAFAAVRFRLDAGEEG